MAEQRSSTLLSAYRALTGLAELMATRLLRRRLANGKEDPDHDTLDQHVADPTRLYLRQEIGESETGLRPARRRSLKQVEESDQQQADDHPEGEILAEIVHRVRLDVGLSTIYQRVEPALRPPSDRSW